MRVVRVLAAVLILGACMTRDPAVSVSNASRSGNWRVERQVDRITGAPLPSAQLMTSTSSNSFVASTRPAGLQLIPAFERPDSILKSWRGRDSFLTYRIDSEVGDGQGG